MTKQESFKRRVRSRMAKTGEKYGAARRVLLEQANVRHGTGGRKWVSQPEVSDQRVLDATGRGWDEWCDIIDAWPQHVDGHPAVAAWLESHHHLSGWWSQGVTGGWERITGRRLPGQMPDGTFTANKSKTVEVDAAVLRTLLLDDEHRADLFPGQLVALLSKPSAKAIRLGIGDTVARLSLTDKSPAAPGAKRAAVSVQHSKLADADAIDEWKFYWDEWLDAIDESA